MGFVLNILNMLPLLSNSVVLFMQADQLNANLEATSSKYLQMDEQYKISLKSLQNVCEKLESNQKQLQEDIMNLRRYMQNNRIEHGQGEQHKRETEQRPRQRLEENQDQSCSLSEVILLSVMCFNSFH